MDALGETMENLGLAQEIQKGLAVSLMKQIKWADFKDATDEYAAKYGAMDGWDVYNATGLAKACIKMWGQANGYDLSQARREPGRRRRGWRLQGARQGRRRGQLWRLQGERGVHDVVQVHGVR